MLGNAVMGTRIRFKVWVFRVASAAGPFYHYANFALKHFAISYFTTPIYETTCNRENVWKREFELVRV